MHMAQALLRALRSQNARACDCSRASSFRSFSTTNPALERRKREGAGDLTLTGRRRTSVLEDDMDELWEQLEEDSEVNDSPSGGHIVLQEQRQLLHYLRLIEHEMPKLVAYRKPFVPPTSSTPLVVRSIHYQGEEHPVTRKRALVAPLDRLPLKGETAIHKFKLLAGPRWTPVPPKDAGVSRLDDWGNGYIKISCEDFPTPAMNLKWASETLDKLVAEANDGKDTFADLPLDLRHVFSKAQKDKNGYHRKDRVFHRPSIRDFPEEWLPQGNVASTTPRTVS